MFYIVKTGISIEDIVIVNNVDSLANGYKSKKYNIFKCLNEEDLFLKLLQIFSREPYWKIVELIRKFEINASNDYLIKSYCSKSNRLKYYKGSDIYLIFSKQQELNKLDLISICTKQEYINYENKSLHFIIKIKKEILPFCLSFLLKKFTAKDFYFCFKNITGIKNIPTINSNSSTFFIVKNKSKIISYHTSYDSALKAIKLIEDINLDNCGFLKLEIFEVNDYEELLDSIDYFKIQKSSNFEKYMIDYNWYFDYCLSKKYIDISKLNLKNDVFLIRDKNGETVIKDNQIEMYNYVKENKLYSEDIFFFKNGGGDYNGIIKCFEEIKDEFSCDSAVFEYLGKINYIEKIKILKELSEIVINARKQNSVHYSFFCKSDESKFELAFFEDDFNFHKHITSLDYSINCLSYGILNLKALRSIFNPSSQFTYNAKLLRTDISFNISALFKDNEKKSDLFKSLKDMDAILDVDACFKNNKSACGVVVRDKNNEIITKISRKLNATTSVEAEIKGAIFALDYITRLEPNLKNICLRFDCFSVADYLVSTSSSDIGVYYHNFISNIVAQYPDLNIYIKKVRGHSADVFNDIADSLAGNFFN